MPIPRVGTMDPAGLGSEKKKRTLRRERMPLRFTKMHGIGNDYVLVDAIGGDGPEESARPELARLVSDRHFGIGGDGLILLAPPEDSANDARMEMYNADGSRAQMCGNGIRCVAKLAIDNGHASGPTLHIESDAGVKTIDVEPGGDGREELFRVDMGAPNVAREALPLVDGGAATEAAIDQTIEIENQSFQFTGVSMGNPHAVIRWEDTPLLDLPLESWGRAVEHHPWFPERVNCEFIRIISPHEMEMRVWERGSGETLACGTGACACVVAAVLQGWCDRKVVVHLRGGDLTIEWPDDMSSVWMTGSATSVFSGTITNLDTLSRGAGLSIAAGHSYRTCATP
ncbi:MAG: diaminopimelate epimerase [Planctomycetota bacterium]